MSRKPIIQLKAFATAISIVVGMPLGARLLWLWLGPPTIDLAAQPQNEFARLDSALRQDLLGWHSLQLRLRHLGVSRNLLVINLAGFFFSANLPKYAECFLDLARHHLDDRELAKQALWKAIIVDRGWNSKQAVGIFVAKYSDDILAEQVCRALNMYGPNFARQQLINLSKETHSPVVHAAVLVALGRVCKEHGDRAGAKLNFERANIEMEQLAPTDLIIQRIQLRRELLEIDNSNAAGQQTATSSR